MCGHPHTATDFVSKTRKSEARKSLSAYYSSQRIESAIDSFQSVTATRQKFGNVLDAPQWPNDSSAPPGNISSRG
jgi:hypothetical protein